MRLLTAFVAIFVLAMPVKAEEKVERLMDALQVDEVIDILRNEGHNLGQDLQQAFLENQGGQVFLDQVDRIYDAKSMRGHIVQVFEETLTDSHLDRAILFFESDLGKTITSLELSARVALSDEAIEEMANNAYVEWDRNAQFYRLVDEYIMVNNLIDENVQNALSADFNFFRGMSLGSGDDAELLTQLLEQKDDTTESTRTWLYSFFLLAYKPLSNSEMRENIAFSRTETGIAVNTALFESFDQMFDSIYYKLGQAVAQVLQGSDL